MPFLCLSYAFLMPFLCLSYAFLMPFLCLSYAFLMPFLCLSHVFLVAAIDYASFIIFALSSTKGDQIGTRKKGGTPFFGLFGSIILKDYIL